MKANMRIERISKVLIITFVANLLLLPISGGIAQGYFPDATLTKPVPPSRSGKIKFREDWVYRFGDGKLSPLGVKIGYDRFDTLGLKIEEANYDAKGNPTLEVTYSYDEWGREAQCLGLRNQKNFYRKWAYEFIDSSKSLIKSVYNNTISKEKSIYRFDAKGNIIEEVSYDQNGDLLYRYVILYTNFNKPAELIEYSGNGTVYERWVYKYNSSNQNSEVLQFNSSNELFRKYKNLYDEFGNQKEVLTEDTSGNLIERTISVYQFFK